MGELHLEIIKDRIRKNYKIDVDTGPLQIAYKERLISSRKDEFVFDVTLGDYFISDIRSFLSRYSLGINLFFGFFIIITASKRHVVKLVMSVLPKEREEEPFITVDKTMEAISNTSSITSKQISLIKSGAENAILHGPKIGCPVSEIFRTT